MHIILNMLCYVVLCFVMLCYAMLCYAMLSMEIVCGHENCQNPPYEIQPAVLQWNE